MERNSTGSFDTCTIIIPQNDQMPDWDKATKDSVSSQQKAENLLNNKQPAMMPADRYFTLIVLETLRALSFFGRVRCKMPLS